MENLDPPPPPPPILGEWGITVPVLLSKIVGRVILKVSWSLSLHLFVVFDPCDACCI